MRCPQCNSAIEIVGKFFVCPEHGPVEPVREPEPAAGTPLDQLVLDRFPFAVAYGYARVVAPGSATHAVDCVFYTYIALLRFVALTFLGQFLSSPGQNPKAAKPLRHLQSPTLSSWFTALNTLAQQLFPPLTRKPLAFSPFPQGGPFAPDLVEAALAVPRLSLGEVRVHERLHGARNERAHGTLWDEDECRRRLPGLRDLLEAALDLFRPLAGLELLRRSPGGMVRLVGADASFPEEALAERRLEDLFEQSETVLRNAQGELLPVYPLFLAPDEPLPQGYTEPLLVFDGHGRKAVMYLGVRSWTERQDTLARYLELLRAKDIDPHFTKAISSPGTSPSGHAR